MKVIFKFAVRTYNIYNPMVGLALPKRKNAEIQLLDKAEQGKLQSYIAKNQNLGTLGTALSYSTGIRIGELCALQWKDIDLEKRILTVSKTMQRIQCKNGANKTKLIITNPKSDSSKRKIGMDWNRDDARWNKGYTVALQFAEEYGDINKVTAELVYRDYHLGSWVSAQRNRYRKGYVSKERIEKLEKIGLKWNV